MTIQTRYSIIIAADQNSMIRQMNVHLKDGWKASGGVSVHVDANGYDVWAQAIVVEEEQCVPDELHGS